MANVNIARGNYGGRLTSDPELRSTPAGTLCTNFTVAQNYVNRDGNPETAFWDCVAWGERANFITKWFKKGSSILVWGDLKPKEWTDRSGAKHKGVELTVDKVSFVDSKDEATKAETSPVQTVASKFVEVDPEDENLPF